MKKFLPLLLLGFAIVSCNDYGKKVKHGHVETYYKNGITESEAQKAADLMYNVDVMAGNQLNDKSFQLTRENNTVHFRMVVNKDKMSSVNDFNFLAIGNYVSDSVFNGAPVDMDLTNNKFELIRSLPYKKLTPEDYEKAK